jgi:hypothetical protein
VKHVVSVSLGSSKRDKSATVEMLGEQFLIERRGTDGDIARFSGLFSELDGKVDALGVGGADIYLWIRDRRYAFRQIRKLVAGAVTTPVVDGSGLKNTLERRAVLELHQTGALPLSRMKAFLVMAVDRYGMARALGETCAQVIYGDLILGLGMPIPIRSYRTIARLGAAALPVITLLPFRWFYPTGSKQEASKPKGVRYFHWADLVAGDWHYIKRHMPPDMNGKTVLTNTLRRADLDLLRGAGAVRAVTTTPEVEGETFGANVMEGVIVALLGKRPDELTPADYEEVLNRLAWHPNVIDLSTAAVA